MVMPSTRRVFFSLLLVIGWGSFGVAGADVSSPGPSAESQSNATAMQSNATAMPLVTSAKKPNIVVILADDLGYGDVQPNNPDSKIPTPAFNRLAEEGVRFSDAHSGSGVCTPTRYGLVCGRYCWRTKMKRGVLGGYSKPLIAKDRQTIAGVLQSAGYRTGCVGKWHLGLGWQWSDESPDNINHFGIAGERGSVNYELPITDGPTTHGFDESYIIPASLDMSPYVFVKNDRVTMVPDQVIPGVSFPKFFRKGEISSDFEHVHCLSHLMGQAQQFIRSNAKTEQPFFLYFPMPAPHKPVIPNADFQGKTTLGSYGDFVAQVDWTVGQVLATLDEMDVADDTLLIVTSDNGSFMHRYDDATKPDHIDDESIQGFRAEHHRANGPLRGTKADVWEAGHRVPFFCRWPGKVKVGQTSSETICLTDILATAAAAAGATFDANSAEDSFSFLGHALISPESPGPIRPAVINHSSGGMFAIRNGKWKLVLGNGSGGRQQPQGKPFEQPYHLFDLDSDLGETKNLVEQNPEIEQKLIEAFEKIAHGDQDLPTRVKPATGVQKPAVQKPAVQEPAVQEPEAGKSAAQEQAEQLWCQYEGMAGPGKGKHIVLIAGDDEYRSEQCMPMLGKILAIRHGFKCTVLFPIDPADGTIKPDHQTNIPGMEQLDSADLVILGLRFRHLPDEQMKHFADYVDAGKPFIGLRTSTHSFNYPRDSDSKYRHYSFNDSEWKGGFGQQVLGDTWISHHGGHKVQSTRGVIAEGQKNNEILRGVTDVWGPSDVYGIRNLPDSAEILLRGQVLTGMSPDDGPVSGKQNDPMMPLAWTRMYPSKSGDFARIFCTTMGASTDFESEGLRRLIVNASYWCLGMEKSIPQASDVDYVDPYQPTEFGFGSYKKGQRPKDFNRQK